MSLDFKCKDFDPKTKKIVESEGSAKMPAITGLGGPGIYIMLPPNAPLIPSEEFCEIIRYFLTNTDLAKDDPRIKLVKALKKIRTVDGYNGKKTRAYSF